VKCVGRNSNKASWGVFSIKGVRKNGAQEQGASVVAMHTDNKQRKQRARRVNAP